MEAFFAAIKYLVFGFLGLIGLLFVLALVFGKRVRKQWEFEAEFRDENGREFGEFDVESSRVEKEEPDFTLKAKFRMRHTSLLAHQPVEVYVDDVRVLAGTVETEGRIFLNNDHLKDTPSQFVAGQSCRIVVGGNTLFTEALRPD